jgi:anthranilate/para-aminobenzoate synthase component II
MRVARYHSLAIDADHFPRELQVTAQTDDGVIMAVRHRQRPVYGVQFHPESVLTDHGLETLSNFVSIVGSMSGAATP